MMNTKKIAALSLFVIFGIGQVSASNKPFDIEPATAVGALSGIVDNTDVFNDTNGKVDPAKVKKTVDFIAAKLLKDASDHAKEIKENAVLGSNDIKVGTGKNLTNLDNEARSIILLYHFIKNQTSGGGNSSSKKYDVKWLVGTGVIGLVIGGAGAYFVLSGSGGSDE